MAQRKYSVRVCVEMGIRRGVSGVRRGVREISGRKEGRSRR